MVTHSNDYRTNEPIGVVSKPGVRDAQFIYAGRFAPSGLAQVHSETLLQGQLGRIRDVRQGADGYIYLLNDTSDAGLFRLEPVN